MPSIGWQELAIVLVIVIIIFGAGKLPELSGAIGKSIREFRANNAGDALPVAAATPAGSAPAQARADEI